MNLTERLEKYAELLIVKGCALKEGQELFVRSPIQVAQFTRMVVACAYKHGARHVTVSWSDEAVSRLAYDNAPLEVFEATPSWQAELNNSMARNNAAVLTILSDDPQAMKGIDEMRKHVDALVIIPNQRLLQLNEKQLTFQQAFVMVDDVLHRSVKIVSDMINKTAVVNVDFSDLSTIIKNAGDAHIAIGTGSGDKKVEEAVQQVVNSPLLETSINGAHRVIINITASADISLDEIDAATTMVHDASSPDVNLIFGVALDPNFNDEMSVTVIATGFDDSKKSSESSVPDFIKYNFDGDDNREPEPSFLDEDLMQLFNSPRK